MDTINVLIAAATAHRACCGSEHDPANGKLHGYCVVCGVEWPCDTAKAFLAPSPAEPLPTYPDIDKARSEWDPSAPALHVELRNILGLEPHQSIASAIMILQANLKAAKADLVTMTTMKEGAERGAESWKKIGQDAEAVMEQKNDLLEAAVREVEAQRKLVGTLQTEITTLVSHEQEWLDAWKGIQAEDPADLRRQFDSLLVKGSNQALTISEQRQTIEDLESQVAGLQAQHDQDEEYAKQFCTLAEPYGWNMLDGSVYDWIAAKLNAHAEAQVKILGADSLARALNTANARVSELEGSRDLFERRWVASQSNRDTLSAEVERLKAELVEAKAEVDLWYRRSQEHATEEERAKSRLAAAKAGEPPMPNLATDGHCAMIRLEAWGRQGWDAAAALRENLQAAQERGDRHMTEAGLLKIELADHRGRQPAETHLCISDPEDSGKIFYVRGLKDEGIKVVLEWKAKADLLDRHLGEIPPLPPPNLAFDALRKYGETLRSMLAGSRREVEDQKIVISDYAARLAAFEQPLDGIPPLPKFEHWHSDAYRAREIAQFATTMRGWFAQERAGRADLIRVAVLAERERCIKAMVDAPQPTYELGGFTLSKLWITEAIIPK